MQFKKIASPSLKELFVRQLEGMILSNELPIGARLPAERDLAEQMGVSRAVINAGIGDMAAKGFLEIHPRKGIFVADYRRTGSLATLISIMEYNGGLLPNREIKSLLELRLAMEILCLQLAIPARTNEGIERLGQCLEAVMAAKTPLEVAEGRFEFGHELDCLSGNTLLPLLGHSFRTPCISLWTEYGRRYGIEPLQKHCEQTFDFVKNGDVEGAVAHVTSKIKAAIENDRQLYRS